MEKSIAQRDFNITAIKIALVQKSMSLESREIVKGNYDQKPMFNLSF